MSNLSISNLITASAVLCLAACSTSPRPPAPGPATTVTPAPIAAPVKPAAQPIPAPTPAAVDPTSDAVAKQLAEVRAELAAAKKIGIDIDTPDEFAEATSSLQLGETAAQSKQFDEAKKHLDYAHIVLTKAVDMIADVTLAMDTARKDAELAVSMGLRESSWDLVRIAHEDIAASKTSFDNHEFPSAKSLAVNTSKDLNEEIAKTLNAILKQAQADLPMRAPALSKEQTAMVEQHLAAAAAAMQQRDYHTAKEKLDRARIGLNPGH